MSAVADKFCKRDRGVPIMGSYIEPGLARLHVLTEPGKEGTLGAAEDTRRIVV
jgi:hypothetical protein